MKPSNNLEKQDSVRQKKWILWTMAAAQAAENHGDKWGLTWYLWWRIHTSIPTWTHSQNFTSSSRSTDFKDTLPWNISQMITKTIPISTRIVITYAVKRGIPLWIWGKVNENWDNNMIRISQWKESHCRTNTSIRRKKEIQKSMSEESQSGIRVVKLTIWVRLYEIEKL